MPQAIFVFVATAVFEALGAASIAAEITAVVVAAAAVVAVGAGLSELASLFGPSTPKPEGIRETTRQALPPRRRGCGIVRLGGAYLVDYADSDLHRVVAFLDQPYESILAYYLSQDQVQVVSGNVQPLTGQAYRQNNARITTTFGVSGTNAFSDLTAECPTIWPSNSYGTGIFMGYLWMHGQSLQNYPAVFPRGKVALNVVAKVNPVYDWRDGAQSRTNPATWKVSSNPIVNLVNELWRYRNYDWTTDFAPTLSILTAEADVCDAAIGALNILAKVVAVAGVGATSVNIAGPSAPPTGVTFYLGGQSFTVTSAPSDGHGGFVVHWSGTGLLASVQIGGVGRWQASVSHPVTEPTYACGGAWNADEAEAITVQKFMDAMDGWMMRRGSDGAMVIRAGHYYEPTVIIGADEVISYTWQPFVEAGRSINEILPAFVCPAYDYNQVDTTPMRDDADISVNGLSSQPFQPDFVQSNGQVRRLAKRKLSRFLAHTETITLKASGLRALGERYIRLRLGYGEVDELDDIVVEIVGDAEIINNGMAVTFQIAKADPNIDEWDPYTDEGEGPADASSPAVSTRAAPTLTAATAFDQASGSAVDGIRLAINASPPGAFSTRDDLTWVSQWRIVGATSWNQDTYTGLAAGAVEMDTGFVPADASIEVQAAYITGVGALSDWSASTTVSTSTAAIAPATPTGAAATSAGAGLATVTWRNPTSSNFDRARVWINTVGSFGTATDASGPLPGSAGALESWPTTGLATGTYWFWVVAENSSGAASTPDAAASVAVA